ncbi:hypothetical protein L218DRAFT_868068 [Marasmius fiardii PR-910]|nr:hypothetical protein L218DRAFT_868068 [Marasmius fiardii PR-910]
MGWKRGLTLLPHGKLFLKHRKLFQNFLGRREILTFNHVLAQEARLLVKNLFESGHGNLLKYVNRFIVSIIMRVTYGHQVKSDDDIFLKIANDFTHISQNSGPIGNTPVDFFPWQLIFRKVVRHFPSWFPGTYYATVARSWYKDVRGMHDASVEFVRAGMVTTKKICRNLGKSLMDTFYVIERKNCRKIICVGGAREVRQLYRPER